jgi:hypothetical protein
MSERLEEPPRERLDGSIKPYPLPIPVIRGLLSAIQTGT